MTTDLRAAALEALAAQTIELPSWAFGNSGTRFKVFGQPGVAREPFEKLEDAAQVHRYTGVAPRVSLHIPWDVVEDYGKLTAHDAQCVDIMRLTGSTDLKLWLPDGTNYAGQDDLRGRQDRLAESLQEIYA